MAEQRLTRRARLAEEVLQTSAMDCGPAALKCLLAGFGVPASYDRLREACQTEVDGTSIDTIEEVARQLGLDAEQVIVPVDHLLLDEARALPALVVVRLPNGLTHFVVVWRRHGRLVQVMDPAVGRRWTSAERFAAEVYTHRMVVPAAGWRDWAGTAEFLDPLARRLHDATRSRRTASALVAAAAADPGWYSLAALDAALRFVESLVRAGALRRGGEAERLLRTRLATPTDAAGAAAHAARVAPDVHWLVRPAVPDDGGEPQLEVRGAVLVRVRGRIADAAERSAASADLAAALAAPRTSALRAAAAAAGGAGAIGRGAAVLLGAVVAGGAAARVGEGLLLGALLGARDRLALTDQRIFALGYLIAFAVAMLLLELGAEGLWARVGRRVEVRLRTAFLGALLRLPERYVQSRAASDMAERLHAVHRLRTAPRLAAQGTGAALQLVLTAGAVAWLSPAAAGVALAAALTAVLLPVVFWPAMREEDLRVRTHTGALSRFYLDALLGLTAVRAHGAERAVRREHEALLSEWGRSARRRLRSVVLLDLLQAAAGYGFATAVLLAHARGGGGAGSGLLLAFWALTLPALGEEISTLARQYPTLRNVLLRLVEPLRTGEAADAGADADAHDRAPHQPAGATPAGIAVGFEGVTVRAGGHVVLEDVSFRIRAGEHVGIVGRSGAGKSTLVTTLLGLQQPSTGRVLADGHALTPARAQQLRDAAAWIDPAVQLWNRPLLDNVTYGAPRSAGLDLGTAVGGADLHALLDRLPGGLQASLGEGGGLVSAGEGQRVRLARAMLRPGARLAVLDEPFRGLDGGHRQALLARVRRLWRHATVLCVTHDVRATLALDRVLVLDGGRVVEDGAPAALADDPGSRYRALLDAEHAAAHEVWGHARWSRLRLHRGRLAAQPGAVTEPPTNLPGIPTSHVPAAGTPAAGVLDAVHADDRTRDGRA